MNFRRRRKKQHYEEISIKQKRNVAASVYNQPDIVRKILSYSDIPRFGEVCKAWHKVDSFDVRQIHYYSHQMCNFLGFISQFDKLIDNSNQRRACHLSTNRNEFYLEYMMKKYRNLKDLAITNLKPANIKFKDRSLVFDNKKFTPLKSIWISYQLTDSPTLFSLCLRDGESISFDFIYVLFDFLNGLALQQLETLSTKPEFKGLKYFCLSTNELHWLVNFYSGSNILLGILWKCVELQGVNLPSMQVDNQEFFQRWLDLIVLRIEKLKIAHGIIFDLSAFRFLQILHIGVDGSFPMEIHSQSLITLEVRLVDPIAVQRVIIGDDCSSLKKISLQAERSYGYHFKFPVKSLTLEDLYLDSCSFINDHEKAFLHYPKLKKLSLENTDMGDQMELSSQLIHLERLIVIIHSVEIVYLPEYMEHLQHLCLGGNKLNHMQSPLLAPNLCSLRFCMIDQFNSNLFQTVICPNITNLQLIECILPAIFTMPSCFPKLTHMYVDSQLQKKIVGCEIEDLILPRSWNASIKIKILDWVKLKDIYDCAGGLQNNLVLMKNDQRCKIIRSKPPTLPDFANKGIRFTLRSRRNIRNREVFFMKQVAYFDPIEIENLTTYVNDSHKKRSNCVIL